MGRIVQPVGKIKLTNVAIVRYDHGGKRFEIACYKNKIVNWRNGIEKDIDEVLQIPYIFVNATKGITASNNDLISVFGTADTDKVSRIILEKGKEQISEKERSYQIESLNAEIATLISEMCYNPKTDAPYTMTMIQRAMKDAHVNIKQNQSPKKQALEIIQILKKTMDIRRRQMLIQLSCKKSNTEALEKLCETQVGVKVIEKIEKGNSIAWQCVIDTNQYKEFESYCSKHKAFTCEILARQYVLHDADEKEENGNSTPVEQASETTSPTTIVSNNTSTEEAKPYTSFKFKCSTCETGFEQPTEHREHFRSDWHRYNLKRKNRNLPIMSEAEFNSLDDTDRELFLNQDSIATFGVCYISFHSHFYLFY